MTLWTYPCTNRATVALTFAGLTASYLINSSDFNLGQVSSTLCVGGVIGNSFKDANGAPLAIVGDEMSLCLDIPFLIPS